MPEIAGWLEGCGGYVAKYWVDGVLVYLGYPRTHEDDAERVVQAGLEYRRQRRHSRGLGWRAGVSGRHILEFQVRTGGFVEPVSARHFPISVSACLRPVRYVMETGLRSRFRACTAAQVEDRLTAQSAAKRAEAFPTGRDVTLFRPRTFKLACERSDSRCGTCGIDAATAQRFLEG
jgi:hypothetical protein